VNGNTILVAGGAVALCCASVCAGAPNAFEQENLVSDVPGLAQNLDPNLVNPWGLTSSATSPFWVANNGTGTSTLYNGPGVPQGLVVTIPGILQGVDSVPTGAIFNSAGAFPIGPGGQNAAFLFSTEKGAIAAWHASLGTTAANMFVATDGAVYKGLALAGSGATAHLYAPDFANGKIDVIDANFQKTTLAGSFVDPILPSGYAPFNIQNLGGKLYVTYALRNGSEDVPGPGNGFVDVFDLNGNFQQRLLSGGALNSPWGLAIAPADFGPFGGNLLVGNFGDGRINAYDLTNGAFLDTLKDENGDPIEIDGLWALKFGNGGNGGDPDDLYFTAGISDEEHGLFGEISAAEASGTPTVPDGGAPTAFLLGFAFVALTRAKRTLRPKSRPNN
jgi:uncharacterized protein (TIGR03118 family)